MVTPDPKEPNKDEMHGLLSFVKQNKWEAISYVILFAGIILSIMYPFFGGLLVGIILGIYFSQEIFDKATTFKALIVQEGIFRGFIVVAALLAFLIEAPGLFIGTAVGAWLRPLFGKNISSPFDKS
jgi:hypothetical protein